MLQAAKILNQRHNRQTDQLDSYRVIRVLRVIRVIRVHTLLQRTHLASLRAGLSLFKTAAGLSA